MTTLRSSRAIAVLLLITLWPALGLAQSAPPAGVVTGIQGTARLVRPVVAQPIPLKFKDDLFLRDQVETRENSVVRVLLGGKALVTIRELSTFTITEEPGRAAIDLKSGKIAVGVAKSLLKPGEAIEIRTPNAIAAVRGSLLIASVVISGGVPQSSFIALDASLPITVTPLGGSATAVALNANQAVGVSGIGTATAVGPVQNVTPEVARREAQTTAAPRAADGQGAASPMAAQISAAKAQEAAMLASLIAPAAAGTTPPPADATLASASQPQLLQEPGSTLTTASQTALSSVPPPPSTGSLGVNASATETASSESTPTAPDGGTSPPVEPPPVVPPPVVPPPVVPPPVVPPPGGPIVISNQNLALAAGQTLKTYSGQSASADTAAAVTVTNSTVTGAGNLIVVEPGANASLAGPLLNVTGPAAAPSMLMANSSVVDIQGILSSATTGSFISIDPTIVSTTNFLRILGGSLNLAGPLLNDVQGIYALTGDFLSVQGGPSNATLTASGVAPLLRFSGSLVGLGAPASAGPNRLLALGVGSTASLGGSLVSLTNNSTLGIGGPAGSALVAIATGSVLTSASASPFADLSNSALVLGPGVSGLLATGGTASFGGSFLRAAGTSTILSDLNVPIVDLTNTAVDITGALVRLEGGSLLQSGGVKVTGGSLTANALVSTDGLGNILAIGGTALDLINTGVTLGTLAAIPDTDTVALNLGLNQPALRLSSSALTLTNVNDTVLSLGVDGGPVLPTISGVGVITSGAPTAPSTLSLKGTLFELAGVNATATQPMVQLDQTTIVQTETANDLISVLVPTGVTSTMAGPLLSVTNSTLNASGRLLRFGGGGLTSTTVSPFLFFDPSSITSAQQMIQLDGGFNLTLAGPLVSAQNTSFHINDPSASAFGFATILDGAKLTGTGTGPLLTFDASSSFDGGNVVSVRRSASLNPSTLTLAGPLLMANGSSFNTSSSGLGPILGTSGGACCSLISITQGGQLSSTTASPLIQLTGSQVFAGPDAQSGGSIFSVAETFAAAPSGELVAPSSVVLQGPLLTASGSSLSALFNLLLVARSSFASTTTAPLIQLIGTTVNLGGVDPFTSTNSQSRLVIVSASSAFPASLSLQGPLVSATLSEITTGQEILGVFNGASLTSSHPGALLSISGGSATAGTAVPAGQGGNFFSFASSVGLSPSVSLVGPLLDAVSTTLVNGNPASNTFSFMFIGDSAAVTSISTAPFLAFDNVSLTASAGILSLRRSLSAGNPTTLALGGPLFAATNGSTFNVTSSAFGSTCCTGFSLGQGVQLVSTGTEALIQLTNSTFNAGPHPQAGGGNVVGVFDTGACCGETNLLVAPSNVSLAGPLLSATNSQISALFNVLSVNRSSFTSTGIDPLVEVTGSTVSLGGVNPFGGIGTAAKVLTVVSSSVSGTIASPTSVSLAGPLLRATNSSLSMTEDVVEVFGGGTFSSQTSAPLIQLSNTSLTAGTPTLNGDVLEVGGTGGSTGTTPSSANLSGPLLSVSAGSSLSTTGSFFVGGSPGGGETTVSGLSAPFVLITGGTHAVASNAGVGMFRLFGNGSVAADAESGLSLGTYRPLQSAAVLADGSRPIPMPLLETVGATVSGQKILRMDTALLEATAPLFNLRSNGSVPSTLNATGTDAIDLSFGSRVSALGSSLIRLDNSVLNVVNGSLVNVNASKLTVSGDLISLLNGAKLTLGAGSLLSVQGGGFASIGGALVNFGGTGGNAITVNNGLVPTGFINGIPVFSSLGGTTGFSITNSTPLVGLNTLGTITINGTPLPSNATAASGITGSLIGIQGTGGQVKIGLQ